MEKIDILELSNPKLANSEKVKGIFYGIIGLIPFKVFIDIKNKKMRIKVVYDNTYKNIFISDNILRQIINYIALIKNVSVPDILYFGGEYE